MSLFLENLEKIFMVPLNIGLVSNCDLIFRLPLQGYAAREFVKLGLQPGELALFSKEAVCCSNLDPPLAALHGLYKYLRPIVG
jgi:hypothetical protein